MIAQLMRIREENRLEMIAKRIDRRWKHKQKEMTETMKKIHAKYASGKDIIMLNVFYLLFISRVNFYCYFSYSNAAFWYGA